MRIAESFEAAKARQKKEIEPLMLSLRTAVPRGSIDVAYVHQDYAFVYEMRRGLFWGAELCKFYVSQEAVDWSPTAHLPDETKSIGENGIDSILMVERNPFLIVTFDEHCHDYVQRVTEFERQLRIGEMRRSQLTQFSYCRSEEILGRVDYSIVRVDGKDAGFIIGLK